MKEIKFYHKNSKDFIYTLIGNKVTWKKRKADEINYMTYEPISIENYFKEGIWVKVKEEKNNINLIIW
jgi:hypothetical protein